MDKKNRLATGFTLLEVVVAMTIFLFVGLGLLEGFKFIGMHTQRGKDKSFATQKVAQIMGELRAIVESPTGSAGFLRSYNSPTLPEEGDVYKEHLILTANRDVVKSKNPCDPLSGNCEKRYVRTISIKDVMNDQNARQVTVRVYLAETKDILAESTSIIRSSHQGKYSFVNHPTYIIAIDNVPSWLRNKYGGARAVYSDFANLVEDFEAANIDIKYDLRRISRSSYGRDPFYSPYVNWNIPIENVPKVHAKVYHYPGLLSRSPFNRYFSFASFRSWQDMRHIKIVNTAGNIDSELRVSWSDQYNHAVRYPDEVRLFGRNGRPVRKAPTLRMLIEGMNQSDDDDFIDYRNMTIINLHGRTFPMPPMRNYSDAAKNLDIDAADPPNVTGQKYYRAVSHPENIDYPLGEEIRIRVYAYIDASAILTHPAGVSHFNDIDLLNLSVVINHPGVPSSTVQTYIAANPIQAMLGERPNAQDYEWKNAIPGTYYNMVTLSDGRTKITFLSTPISARDRPSPSYRGLYDTNRLYDMEYIPCLVGTGIGNDYKFHPGINDLADQGAKPKNTARWVIKLPSPGSAGMYTIETRIGTDHDTGTMTKKPANLSRTYVWIGPEAAGELHGAAPITERYQFMGDPRHMPYADVKKNHGYNWYFGVNPSAEGYLGFTKGPAGPPIDSLWDPMKILGGGAPTNYRGLGVNMDVPRYFEVFRKGLIASRSTLINPSGVIATRVAVGGEVGLGGLQSPEFADGVEINEYYWDPTKPDSQTVTVDESKTNFGLVQNPNIDKPNLHLISNDAENWYSRYWLGELYPDDAYDIWVGTGNLRVGVNEYKKVNFGSVPPPTPGGTPLPENDRVVNTQGAAAFFNGNDSGAPNETFAFRYSPTSDWSNATIMNQMRALGDDTYFELPPTMDAFYPFSLNDTNISKMHVDFNKQPFVGMRTRLDVLEIFYKTPADNDLTHYSSALVRMWDPAYPNSKGAVLLNGFNDDWTTTSIEPILKVNMLQALLARMVLGRVEDASHNPYLDRITQTPKLRQPVPESGQFFFNNYIDIKTTASWVRWDEQKYYNEPGWYPDGGKWGEDNLYEFAFVYSADHGSTWKYLDDNSSFNGIIADILDTKWVEWADAASNPSVTTDRLKDKKGILTYRWDITPDFPDNPFRNGEYLLRVFGRQKGVSAHEYSAVYSRFNIER